MLNNILACTLITMNKIKESCLNGEWATEKPRCAHYVLLNSKMVYVDIAEQVGIYDTIQIAIINLEITTF